MHGRRLPRPGRPSGCPVHVGRDEQIATVRDTVAQVEDGGCTLLIAGEAGIGKSRLAREALTIARERGLKTVLVRCTSGAAPYEPFVAALRSMLAGRSVRDVQRLLRGTGRIAVALLPELQDHYPALKELSAADLDAGVSAIFTGWCRSMPALVVIEDLHWASAETVRLLMHLARDDNEIPLGLCGTFRHDELDQDHPLRAALPELERTGRAEIITLRALTTEAVGEMVRATLDVEAVDAGLVALVADRSHGNPLFVEELCRALSSGAGPKTPAALLASTAMPATLRQGVAARVARLGIEVAQMLRLAAVAGETIDPDLLSAAAGMPRDAVEDVLSAGIAANLVTQRSEGGPPTYSFSHALTREALLADLSGAALAHAHRDVAAAIESTHAGRIQEIAGVLADHLAACGDLSAAHGLALVAAQRAWRIGAGDEAARRFDQAVSLAGNNQLRLDAHVVAASRMIAVNRPAMVSHLDAAMKLSKLLGDRLAMAQIELIEGRARWWDGDSEGALESIRRGWKLLQGRGDGAEAEALLELGRIHANRDEGEQGATYLDSAVSLAVALDKPGLLADSLNVRATLGGTDDELEVLYSAARDAAERVPESPILVLILINGGIAALWYQGAIARARAWLRTAVSSWGASTSVDAAQGALAWVNVVGGQLSLDVNGSSTTVYGRLLSGIAAADRSFWLGDLDAARASAEEVAATAESLREPQWLVPALGMLGRARLSTDIDEAVVLLRRCLGICRTTRNHPHWPYSVDLGRALFAAGDEARLRRWASEVAEVTQATRSHRHDRAALHLVEGMASTAMGDLEGAGSRLNEAIELYASMPCPAREAQAHLALAENERRRGDLGRCGDEARAALAIGSRIGSSPLLDEAAATLRRAGMRARPQPVGGRRAAQLSRREVDVVLLVADGCSNPEIARRLFVSEKTVETHLTHILTKLGLRNRVQVARWASELSKPTI